MTTRAHTVAAFDAAASLAHNVLALTGGLTLWTAVHFGVTAMLPLFLHDQGYNARGIGFMLGAMGVAQLALRPFAGWIVDAFGRRRPLVLSLVVLAGASALLSSPAGWAVLANRVLTGAAYSLGTTAFFTLVVESAPPGRHGEVQGYVALGITLGVGLGPAAAVALYQGFSPTGALPAERLTAVAVGAVVVALSSGMCFSATSSSFQPLGREHPYALRTNFRREGLGPAFLNFCTQIPNAAFSTFLPLWAIARGVGNPGVLFVGSQVGAVMSRLLGGRVADRYGRRSVLVPALVGVAAVLVGMRCASGLPLLFALAVGYGTLYGVAFVILPSLAGEAVPATGRGAAINTMGLGADLAQLLGPWGLGLAAETWGFGGALVAAGVVPMAGAVAYLAKAQRNRSSLSAGAADGLGFDPSDSLWQDRREMKRDSSGT